MLTEKQKSLIHDRLHRLYTVLYYADKDELYKNEEERQTVFNNVFNFEKNLLMRLIENIFEEKIMGLIKEEKNV